MEFQRLPSTIPVLILAGIFFSAGGYFIGGLPKAIEHALLNHRRAGFSGLNTPVGLSFQIQAWTSH
jgi:hypothetical protein